MLDETLIPLAEVPEMLGNVGRDGRRVSIETAKRWARDGVKQPDGSRRKLRALKAGSRWVTTKTWLTDFLTPAQSAETPAVEVRSPSERRRDVDAAMKQLEAMGA